MLKIVHINESTYISHVSRKNSENRTPNLICVQEILQGSQDHCLHKYFSLQPSLYMPFAIAKVFLYINCEIKAIQVITYLL